ncbi:DNA mismatch repair endonuclease MutH [Aliidiomarina taiwanensis]|uniref:DNA mismatch repair protein MutH n=1 Tax=Aliidiomarina taiwanensis TaxID=946228 RepID=A0A432X7Y1_9GAMM|nr:DNA mismatch repair endonuclease MutH [Aliidiomarina taiwanensis]RUO42955.1 DNA mismatch repair endonuclease MutH [Aliidiomarina taiwanensis]
MPSSHFPQPASTPPATEAELLVRAQALAGYSLGQLAEQAGWITPTHLRAAKGWAGQLIELYLGATAGSRQEQDFPELGVELKTIPINEQGMPLETTYVCIAPLLHLSGVQWQQSNVHNKLQRVLWVPLDGRRHIPPGDRLIGPSVLWSPTAEQNRQLQQDWEEITELIVLGQIEQITARTGTVLQLRPKAADGSVLTDAIGPEGRTIQTRPRGYYLKKPFTHQLLTEALGI